MDLLHKTGLLLFIMLYLCSVGRFTANGVSINLFSEIPIVFEGTTIDIICLAEATSERYTWYKDGQKLFSYDGDGNRDMAGTNDLSLPSITERTVTFAERIFLYLSFAEVSHDDHGGVYTCVTETDSGESSSDDYLLEVHEREPICRTNKTGMYLEYLVGDMVALTCYNPIYSPSRDINWYRGTEVLPKSRTEFDDTSLDSTTVTMTADLNYTTFSCEVASEDEDGNNLSTNSCDLGPVRIFDSNFVSISEVEINPKSSVDSRIFTCRLVPRQIASKITWTNLDKYNQVAPGTYNISHTDSSSNITLFDLSKYFTVGSKMDISCTVTTDRLNLSNTHSFMILSPSRRNDPLPDDDDTPSLLFILLIAVVVLLILFVGLFVVICCTLSGSRKPKQRPRPDQPPSQSTEIESSNGRYVAVPVQREPSMVLSKLPDGRFHLHPRQLEDVSETSSYHDEDRAPLSPSKPEDLYDLPPVASVDDNKPTSPLYINNY